MSSRDVWYRRPCWRCGDWRATFMINPCVNPDCGKSRSPKEPRGLCRKCWLKSTKAVAPPKLTLADLDPEQMRLYSAIMRDRLNTAENRAEALYEVGEATKAGTLEAQCEWWKAATYEPSHRVSATGLLQEYAQVWI